MDYPVQLSSQLQQLLKSLRKSRDMTQAELAQRLGVVQSRVADIERDPGAVGVDQLLQVLALLGAQMVVRESVAPTPQAGAQGGAKAGAIDTPERAPDDAPRGQW